MPDLLSLRIPISDGPDGRVGYMYFSEQPDGTWRLSLKERDEHDSLTGKGSQDGVEALANALEAFGNQRIETYQKAMTICGRLPENRPGFRGSYRDWVASQENVRFYKSREMLVKTCLQVGERLKLFGWPLPGERVLNDGTILRFEILLQ